MTESEQQTLVEVLIKIERRVGQLCTIASLFILVVMAGAACWVLDALMRLSL